MLRTFLYDDILIQNIPVLPVISLEAKYSYAVGPCGRIFRVRIDDMKYATQNLGDGSFTLSLRTLENTFHDFSVNVYTYMSRIASFIFHYLLQHSENTLSKLALFYLVAILMP